MTSMRVTLKALHQAAQTKPYNAQAANALGLAYIEIEEPVKSLRYLSRAIKIEPQNAEYHRSYAQALLKLDRIDEAIRSYWKALEYAPSEVSFYNELGMIYDQLPGGQCQSRDLFLRAIDLSPNEFDSYVGLCQSYIRDREAQEAIDCVLEVTRRAYDPVIVYKAAALRLGDRYGRYEEAKQCWLKALTTDPHDMDTIMQLGYVNVALRDMESAMQYYHCALKLFPSNLEVLFAYSKHLFQIGFFEQAKKLSCSPEVRAIINASSRKIEDKHVGSKPEWDGSPLEGKSLLLHLDDGYGDLIEYSRFSTLLHQNGARVIVQARKPLRSLIATIPGVDLVVGKYEDCPPFDYSFNLPLNAPTIDKAWELLGRQSVYLFPPASIRRRWKREINEVVDLNVGIAWKSICPLSENCYRYRSLRLEQLRPLTRVPGIRLYSLQVGRGAEELLMGDNSFPAVNLAVGFRDFMDTAAAISNLDLVITVDTAVAHVAGALGKPCWVILPYMPNWRWMIDRSDSPWYQSVKLFRQAQPGDWPEVITRIQDNLNSLVIHRTTKR
jgi:Flp pilus assembly protein TadD